MEIVKNFSLTDRIGGSIMYENDNFSGYETGERTPSAEILLSLSYLYKCSTDYLLGKSNDMPAILLDTNGLTPSQIKAISALIESIRQ